MKQSQVIATYDYYTLEHKLRMLKQEERRKAKTKYYIKQKLSGLTMIIIGIIVPFLNGDATFSLFALPLGLFLTFTKEKVMIF